MRICDWSTDVGDCELTARRSRTAPTRSTASTRSRTTSPTTGPSDMAEGRRVLVIGPEPTPWSEWAADLVAHGPVLVALAPKDFQPPSKRASFGVLWAVVLPVVQALVLARSEDRRGGKEGGR